MPFLTVMPKTPLRDRQVAFWQFASHRLHYVGAKGAEGQTYLIAIVSSDELRSPDEL